MSDGRAGFFERLERDLTLAAERGGRRRVALPAAARTAVLAAAVAALLALVVVPVLVLSSGGDGRPAHEDRFADGAGLTLPPVGTVIGKGEGDPPRSEPHTVVATGSAPFAGPWQLEAYRGSGLSDPQTGEQYEPPGLDCLVVFLRNPPAGVLSAGSGGCGVQRRTPGFDHRQVNVQTRRGVEEVLVFGHVPERASAVVITAAGGVRIESEPFESPAGVDGDHYLIPIDPSLRGARINWLDADGRPGSSGAEVWLP
jgi:hypothetical protein